MCYSSLARKKGRKKEGREERRKERRNERKMEMIEGKKRIRSMMEISDNSDLQSFQARLMLNV